MTPEAERLAAALEAFMECEDPFRRIDLGTIAERAAYLASLTPEEE